MAYTLGNLADLVLQRLGWSTSDTFVTFAELKNFANDSQRELHDVLISVFGPDYWAKESSSFSATASSDIRTLPTDFWRLLRMDVAFDKIRVPMKRMNLSSKILDDTKRTWERGVDIRYQLRVKDGTRQVKFYPWPSASYLVKVYYIPYAPTMTASTHTTSLGYDEYLVLDMMRKCLMKEQDPLAEAVSAQKAEYKDFIARDGPPIDEGAPSTIVDVRGVDDLDTLPHRDWY